MTHRRAEGNKGCGVLKVLHDLPKVQTQGFTGGMGRAGHGMAVSRSRGREARLTAAQNVFPFLPGRCGFGKALVILGREVAAGQFHNLVAHTQGHRYAFHLLGREAV